MKIFFLIAFFFASLNIQAKEPSLVYFENNQIRITQYAEDCHDEANGTHRQYIFLQFENLIDKPIAVSFKKELWYNEQCTTCEKKSAEHLMSVSLLAKETKTGSCEKREPAFSVFSKMLDKTTNSSLTTFELKNIQISIIK
jgi:hypothetical protein